VESTLTGRVLSAQFGVDELCCGSPAPSGESAHGVGAGSAVPQVFYWGAVQNA
jgi:hypothetical protein